MAALPRTSARRSGRQVLRLVAFGSSTTAGVGASAPARTYPAVMRATLLPAFPGGISLANLGIGGDTCLEMDDRLDAVLAAAPDLVVWQTGSNDVARPVALPRFAELTRRGLDQLAAAGADLVLMDQQYSSALEALPTLPDYRAMLHRIAAEAGVPVFRRYERMRGWCGSGRFTIETLSPDGTHMGDAGYRALGEAVALWLLGKARGSVP